jgi:CBS domain-containing protein
MKTLAKDIMSDKVVVATEDMNIEEAVKLLVNNKITGLPVVDKEGKMVGILSEYDIIARVGRDKKIDEKNFKNSIPYTKTVEYVSEDTPLTEVLDRFIEAKCRRLPVLDKSKRLVGLISRRDIMRVLYYRAKVK